VSGDLFDIRDKVAIVTGGTRGLGAAISRGLAAAGARVVVSGRQQGRCDELAEEIVHETGNEHVVGLACDVTEWDLVPAFVERVHDRFGRIDLLVNNAGMNPPRAPLMEVDAGQVDDVIAIHVKGPLRLSALVAEHMASAGGGAIVNVTSASAYVGRPLGGVYALSKAALLSLSRTMAREWARAGIRVNSIAPGTFHTDILDESERHDPGRIARYAESSPIGRIANPDEIVGTIIYLASDASSYTTGSDLSVDGGGFTVNPPFLSSEEISGRGSMRR